VKGKRVRLLDEVDLISSVSGGSFTSAYYGLFGDQIFDDYETRFLRRNVTGEMIRALLNPINWVRLLFTPANRTDLAVELYDEEIFRGATFADLDAAGGPYLQINSTDLAQGSRFTFVQPQFDLLCSDLHPVQVARAVAASSAVPVLFDSITLKNYAGSCGYELPEYLRDALEHPRRSRRLRQLGKGASSYLDAERRPYVHLVDGGVVDNQGLLAPMETVELMGGITERFHDFGADSPEHIVVIAVDAQVDPQPDFSLSAKPPSLAEVVGAMTGGQINRMTFETIERMRQTLKVWAEELPTGPDGQAPQIHMVELAFDLFEEPEERAYFDELPTSFSLEKEQVDRLIAAGRELLRESPQYQELLSALGGTSPGVATAEQPTQSR
jgi:NTE family protein